MSAVSATQKPTAQLEMKRELESPETPFQGKGRKVFTYLRSLTFQTRIPEYKTVIENNIEYTIVDSSVSLSVDDSDGL